MLRQHLKRLEQPVDKEEKLETDNSLGSEEEKESDHDIHVNINGTLSFQSSV